MKCLLVAINAKYIHSNLAVYNLKACAKQQVPGCQVELAEYTINHRAAEILDDIYLKKADIICFSCYIWNIEYVKLLVKNLKKLCPQVPIWLGGPEVSYDCEACLRELPEIDGILYGEGERSFPGLLQHYLQETSWPDGCVRRNPAGELVVTKPAEPVDMDAIPFVYGDLQPFENKIIYYETSRGCPFSCSYCLSSVDKHLRFRSLPLVEQELAFFLEKQVPQVKLVDRTFNCRKSHAMAIWKFIRDHDNGVTNFHFEVAADLLDEEAIALIQSLRPGLIQLEIGVQSANEKTIAAIRRKMDLERVQSALAALRKGNNVHLHLDLIAGLPWEDYESFGRSFDVVYEMQPSQLQLGFLKVLKGSPMHEEAEQYRILYQTEAPFEVLATPWLSHDDIIRLKQVEAVVEIFYNSGQFSCTMRALKSYFESAFSLYEALGQAYQEKGMHLKKHAREAVYQFLLQFVEARLPEEKERFRQFLAIDFYLRENAKKRPEFALPEEPHRETMQTLCEKGEDKARLRQWLKEMHIEKVLPPLAAEAEYWLFDYQNRDPLTGNAALVRLGETE